MAYRETVTLYAPSTDDAVDEHGHPTAAPEIAGKAAAQLITDDRNAKSTPPGETISGGVQLDLRTNLSIDVGWTLRWRARLYTIRAVSAPAHLKQRVTITPAA